MDVFRVLLTVNIVKWVFLQTCSEFAVHDIAQVGRVIIGKNGISCLVDLSLNECALECLLLKRCRSFNFESTNDNYGTLCWLNSVNHNDDDVRWSSNKDRHQLYVDIRNWTTTAAGTCASRPCAEYQRCLPATLYRCIDIDCGIPPVLPVEDKDTNMYHLQADTSLGSLAYYRCNDAKKDVHTYSGTECVTDAARVCNSDSSWSLNPLFCK